MMPTGELARGLDDIWTGADVPSLVLYGWGIVI
jgi:hypothetical protein